MNTVLTSISCFIQHSFFLSSQSLRVSAGWLLDAIDPIKLLQYWNNKTNALYNPNYSCVSDVKLKPVIVLLLLCSNVTYVNRRGYFLPKLPWVLTVRFHISCIVILGEDKVILCQVQYLLSSSIFLRT